MPFWEASSGVFAARAVPRHRRPLGCGDVEGRRSIFRSGWTFRAKVPRLKGVFYDGFKPYDGTTSASFADGKLTLNIDHYLSTIKAVLDHGQLSGDLSNKAGRGPPRYLFHATRHVDQAAPARAPHYRRQLDHSARSAFVQGREAFRFVVQQKGAEVAAAILRIDGDTGSYSGAYQDGKWVSAISMAAVPA